MAYQPTLSTHRAKCTLLQLRGSISQTRTPGSQYLPVLRETCAHLTLDARERPCYMLITYPTYRFSQIGPGDRDIASARPKLDPRNSR